jgi:hypothetical protein
VINSQNTFANFNITACNCFEFQAGNTTTITNAVSWAGSSSAQTALLTNSNNVTASFALAGGSTIQWYGFRSQIVTSSPTTTNCFDLGNNSGSGFVINAPSGGALLATSRLVRYGLRAVGLLPRTDRRVPAS